MIAKRKFLIFASIGLASLASLSANGDNLSTSAPGTEFAMQEPAFDRACAGRRSTRCLIDVRYAYPAADLYVVPQDIYF